MMQSAGTRMSRRARMAAVATAALVALAPMVETATAATPKEKALRRKINNYRASKGRVRLKMKPKLVTSAHRQAKKMAADGRFDPVADHSSKAQLTSYAVKAKCSSIAEVIDFTGDSKNTLNAILNDWKNSPPHNAALLNKSWKRIGTGVYKDGKGVLWAVALFCKPA